MKKIALIFLAAPALALAACNGDDTPAPAPSNDVTELNSTGGPCGDGTVLGPNEHCK